MYAFWVCKPVNKEVTFTSIILSQASEVGSLVKAQPRSTLTMTPEKALKVLFRDEKEIMENRDDLKWEK